MFFCHADQRVVNQKDEISTKKMTSNIQKKELPQWLSQTKVTFQVTEQETDLSTYSMMFFCHADQRVVNQKDEISTKKMTSNIQKKELPQWLSQTKVTFQVTEQETDLSTYSMMFFCHADQRVVNQKDEISTKKMTSNIQKKELPQWLSQTKVTFQVTEQETDLSTYSMMFFCHADQRVVEDAFSLQHCWSWKIRLPVFFHSWKLETTQATVSKQLHAFGVTVPCICKSWSNPPSPLWVQKQWLQLQILFHCMWFIHHFYCSSFIAYFSQKVVWCCSILIILSTHLYVIITGVNHHNPQ